LRYLARVRFVATPYRCSHHLDELAASDSSVAQLVADDAAEGIGLKITKNGGLTGCRRQRDICIAAGLTISVQDTVGSDIALAAIVQMGQTIPKSFSAACWRAATWFR
jgi:L-alanine-DL-glutamate epimerase-like enolase superfamily enzyme